MESYELLREARTSRKMTRIQMAQMLSVSDSLIAHWEKPASSGGVSPEPEDVAKMGEALDDPDLWYRWMRARFSSFAHRFRAAPEYIIALDRALLKMKFGMKDSLEMYNSFERAVICDKEYDFLCKEKFINELRDLIPILLYVADNLESKT